MYYGNPGGTGTPPIYSPPGGGPMTAGTLPGWVGTGVAVVGTIAAGYDWVRDRLRGNTPQPSTPVGAPPPPPQLPQLPAYPGGPPVNMGGGGAPGGPTIISPGGTQVQTQGLPVQAVSGTPLDRLGRPFVVRAFETVRRAVPRGYVVCDIPGVGVVGVLKGQAIRAGLYRARPKPPISARDAKAIRRAAHAQDKVKRLAGDVGLRMSKPKGKAKFAGVRRRKKK